jgi:hypothetical protein
MDSISLTFVQYNLYYNLSVVGYFFSSVFFVSVVVVFVSVVFTSVFFISAFFPSIFFASTVFFASVVVTEGVVGALVSSLAVFGFLFLYSYQP